MANAEISKAVLGQTLTTEIGKNGSYAAAQAHNVVREDLATADRQRICAAFDRLAAVWTLYNFGTDIAPPKFQFVKDEDLQAERADRDTKLYATGWRPTKSYIMRQYEMQDDDFTLAENDSKDFSHKDAERHFAKNTCTCGCKNKKAGLFGKIAALFASKDEKQTAKDNKLMHEFEELFLKKGQEELDAQIEAYANALGTVDNYEDARAALMSAYDKQDAEGSAHLIDEIRFAAQGIGGSYE
jgi:phage gp29-like protein